VVAAGKIVADDAEVVERYMGDLRASEAFPNRLSIGRARLQSLVDRDVAARVQRHTRQV
jgi:hypothetical protein